eukprot:2432025-Amphidinium_carterae.1
MCVCRRRGATLCVLRTIYLFVGGTSPQTSRTLGELYDRHCGEAEHCAASATGTQCIDEFSAGKSSHRRKEGTPLWSGNTLAGIRHAQFTVSLVVQDGFLHI